MKKDLIKRGMSYFIMTDIPRLLLYCSFVLFLASCTSSSKEKVAEKNIKHYQLKHKFHREIFMRFPRIQVADDYLVVVTPHQRDKFVIVHSIEDNMEEVASYGYLGNGPGEFTQPVMTYADKNIFGLNEINEKELTNLEIIKDDKGNVFVRERERLKSEMIFKKGELGMIDRYYTKLDDSHYVSLLLNADGEFFTLSDGQINPIQRFGESPVDEDLDVLAIFDIFQGKMAIQDGVFYYATHKLPYLVAYQLNGDKMEKLWSRFYRTPHYAVSNGELKLVRDKSTGPLLDMRTDSKYIYLLYLNQLHSEYDADVTAKSCSNEIWVFNHQGEEVACLHLDCRLSAMAIDKKRNKIYGIAHIPDLSLVEFDLPIYK